jgi:hypothetical protein
MSRSCSICVVDKGSITRASTVAAWPGAEASERDHQAKKMHPGRMMQDSCI